MHQTIALRVGKGLQEDGAGAHVHHALDQLIEVAHLLGRVRVVDVVQVHMQHALRWQGLGSDNAVGEVLAVWIGGHQETWAAHQVAEAVEAVFQGQGHLIAVLAHHRQ